jgi:serine/threonine-protein kinase
MIEVLPLAPILSSANPLAMTDSSLSSDSSPDRPQPMSDSDVAAMPEGAASSDGQLNDPDKTTQLPLRPNRDGEVDLSGTMSSSRALSMTLAAPPHMAPAVDLSDCVLDEFRLLRRLGSGGMAQVYLAEQTSLKRTVAIKVMRTDFGGDDNCEQRFEHEARAAAGLNHPNIVQVFAIGQCDEIHYIAQEYVQGLNLRQYLQKRKPPTAHIAVHLMKQVCSALHVAHKAGIVHRDIKPENIMVTRRMTAKVTDFGLAQLTLGGERVNLTQRGVTMGTPMYMSPEQVNGANVDLRSDLYSLGVTFFHVLAGEPPFRAETALALAYKHLNEEAPPLHELRPDLPSSLIAVIDRLMAKDPANRFPDAKAALTELKRIEKSGEVNQTSFVTDKKPANWWSSLPISGRTLRAYAIGCLIVFLLALGMGRRDRRRPNPLDSEPAAPRVPFQQRQPR